MQPKAKVMDEKAVERAVVRISHQIIEKNKGRRISALWGFSAGACPWRGRLLRNILTFEGARVDVGVLDITFYRDDLSLF